MIMGKKYRTERRTINARDVHTVTHNDDAIDYYEQHPNGSYSGWGNGGRPSVGRGSGGRLVAWQGNHRIAAAARRGRRISVDFQVEVEPEPAKKKGFWSW